MRASRSRSNSRKAARSATAVGGSTAFRRSGRSRMIVVTAPLVSRRTPGRSMACVLLGAHGTHWRPCAVRDAGGEVSTSYLQRELCKRVVRKPLSKGKPEALELTAPTWSYQVRNTVGTRQRRGFDSPPFRRLYS